MENLVSAPMLNRHAGTASFPQFHYQAGNFLPIASTAGDCMESVIADLRS
jgi:hypothetical protein